MWKSSIITFIGVLVSLSAIGQFGNEWIDANQRYFKFKIAEDNFYRITRDELQAAGFPVNSIPASRIQLFREGEEVSINVTATTENTIDYLEFYGLKRDGSSDTPLYLSGTQPHLYYNLFSDSASYFLTYQLGNVNGKRMGFSSDRNTTGLTPETYYLEDTLAVFSSTYSEGRQVRTDITLSDYDDGEGWTGSFFGKNQSQDFDLILGGYNGGTDVTLETVLFGGNNLEHNAIVRVGPTQATLSDIGSLQFSGRRSRFFTSTVLSTAIGASNELAVSVFDEGFANQSDRISVGYIRVVYPSDFGLEALENKVFSLDNITQRKAWLRIGSGSADDYRVFDVTDPNNAQRLATTNFSDRIEVVVSDVAASNRIIFVASPAAVGNIQEATLPNLDLQEVDYLMITHPLLRGSSDPVEEYKDYRESEEGGAYKVAIVNIGELYDLFSYGDPTPLAISNCIRYSSSVGPLTHVFIIGKGFRPFFDNDPTSGRDFVAPARLDSSFVNIPTYGNPGTDMMFTLGINADQKIPGVSIGRLNATNPGQISTYLNKIIEMETLPFDDLFRKDFLQLSGGLTQSEINSFSRIVRDLSEIVEEDFIGGRTFNTGKQSNENVEFIPIADRVNEGVGYITFFGHSSGTVADIEVGLVSDPSFGFANKGKYPIFLVNGCDAGEIFDTNLTYGEDWIFEPDLGAINFIAHTSSALSSTLRTWSDIYYSTGFANDEFIGKSVGEVMIETGKQYWDGNRTDTDLTQIRQMQLQGDPAYRIFGADFPDYKVDGNTLFAEGLTGGQILSLQDSFKLSIPVINFGRTEDDSLEVVVGRTFPDGSSATYQNRFQRPLRNDTLLFYIPLPSDRINDGNNLLSITLDPNNLSTELNETNNTATLEVNIFSGNTQNLFPTDNGIVSNLEVDFVWQSSNLLENDRSYELEFDTSPEFVGPNRRSFSVDGEVLLNQSFDFTSLSLPDTTTIYWRTRFTNPGPNESDQWVESSFTLINNSGSDWGQFDNPQLSRGSTTGILFNETTQQWEFQSSSTALDFFTFGADNSIFSTADVRTVIGGVNFIATTTDGECSNNTFNAIAFDREDGSPDAPILFPVQDVSTGAVCGRRDQIIHQFKEDSLIANLGPNPQNILFSQFIEAMDDGGAIVAFNIGLVEYSSWQPEVIATMNQIGVSSSTITSLVDGQPVIILGRKGAPAGSAIVVSGDGSASPITQQSANLQDVVEASFTTGSIRSGRIGPANSWDSFSYKIIEEVNDTYSLRLSGVTPEGESQSLFTRARTEMIDLASIDPLQYPQIELSIAFEDAADQTPLQLDFWEVDYQQPADVLIVPVSREQLVVQEGQAIRREVRAINSSPSNFSDSLSVMARLVNQTTGTKREMSKRIAAPSSKDSLVFDVEFSSMNMAGLNNLIIELAANENENYTSNNRFTQAGIVEVNADETNPIIDVTFDGFHILNGDVVSPNPTIAVRMRDDNTLLFKTDTSGFNISLRNPGEEAVYQRINFSDPRLHYTPASESNDFEVEFQPGPLEDGVYGLRILAEDESGNGIRELDDPYEITFEVINESTITHFYPYPNPFSTSCRFVFTLTGSEIPSQLKIQIMTVSGRVVREITQNEIGPIRIGNNITSFAWDGRDHYGDQLANGVYFYKVFIEGSGNDFANRFTSADRAFKNGFGKLYILR